MDAKWDDAGDHCLVITDRPESEVTGILYKYSTRDRKLTRITYGVTGNWTFGGRYVEVPLLDDLSARGSNASKFTGWGQYLILDSRKHFSVTMRIGGAAKGCQSPSGNEYAFLAGKKDEFGDPEWYYLKVADLATHKTRTLAQGRRKPEFVWHGNNQLAVVTYDRFAIPTLNLIGLDGKKRKLLTAKQYQQITPVETPVVPGSIVYETFTPEQANKYAGDLWSLRPGGKPARMHNPKNDEKHLR